MQHLSDAEYARIMVWLQDRESFREACLELFTNLPVSLDNCHEITVHHKGGGLITAGPAATSKFCLAMRKLYETWVTSNKREVKPV